MLVRSGRKWKAQEAVKNAETRLQHNDIVGTVTSGRQGLGVVTRAMWKTATRKERRIQDEVKSMEDERRQFKAVTMKMQGVVWVNWEGVRNRRFHGMNVCLCRTKN